MHRALHVWLLNPYASGSHQAWAEGYAAASRHRVTLLSMSGYFWKWRMQGGALELAEQARLHLAASGRPDVILATSMTNIPAFVALLRRELGETPVVLYMHENQLTYPPPPGTKRDLTYGMLQHLAMLAAERICFNSQYHLDAWYAEVPRLLKHFPDYTHLSSIDDARAKSRVLSVGCDLQRLDRFRSVSPLGDDHVPLILWNQRWEYDKDPQTMLQALYALAEEGAAFRVALAGASFRVRPEEFLAARERLGDRLIHYGYAEGLESYARLLWSADIVLSTAIHEFFGVSVVEAIYCGARPVLPDRLSYPELVPEGLRADCLYADFDGLLSGLRRALAKPQCQAAYREHVARFDWGTQAALYDDLLSEVSEESATAT